MNHTSFIKGRFSRRGFRGLFKRKGKYGSHDNTAGGYAARTAVGAGAGLSLADEAFDYALTSNDGNTNSSSGGGGGRGSGGGGRENDPYWARSEWPELEDQRSSSVLPCIGSVRPEDIFQVPDWGKRCKSRCIYFIT